MTMPPSQRSYLVGGLAGSLLVVICGYLAATLAMPFNMVFSCLACLAYVSCGLVAVWHYTNEYSLTLTGGKGSALGAKAGALAGAVAPALSYILQLIGILPGPAEALREMQNNSAMDPASIEMMQGFMEFFDGPFGLIFNIVLGMIFGTLLGLVGGAIGRGIWKLGDSPEDESEGM